MPEVEEVFRLATNRVKPDPNALERQQKFAEAEAEYRRVLAADPGDARALRGLAYCQIRRSRFADAAKSYEAATKAEPARLEREWIDRAMSSLPVPDSPITSTLASESATRAIRSRS